MNSLIISAILILANHPFTLSKSIDSTENPIDNVPIDDNFDNNIIDFDEEYSIKFNKNYGTIPWHANDFKKESHRYTISNDLEKKIADKDRNAEESINNDKQNETVNEKVNISKDEDATSTVDYSVIPLELLSTTENILISIVESTAEPDLTVIPLSTTESPPNIVIDETITLPSSTQVSETSSYTDLTTEIDNFDSTEQTTNGKSRNNETKQFNLKLNVIGIENVTKEQSIENTTSTNIFINTTTEKQTNVTEDIIRVESLRNSTDNPDEIRTTTSKTEEISRSDPGSTESDETNVPIFTELDADDVPDVPEDYYDSKDIVPTTAPKTDAISVIFGLAGSVVESVVESVAERVVPKSIFDLFKRMQRQNEALEAERLRSREENGGLGQFGRGILKSISSGLTKPLSQLMAGAKDIGSLDTDRGFVGSLASGVTSVANVATSVVDSFKDRVQAIYPGTVWCGDGRSATARSSDLGLFFFTDTCCRQHDACKLYIKSGDTKYGLTNTGLFTRSHCSCDAKFRECLVRTNSLVSAQIGLTYFNVLGPQCFRRAHPIVRCVRRTRITGQKCEEYELDYTKPRMWQWFDNETF